jgi:glutamate synthase domain-containing protein 1/glutamate synthase domain-containing protein 3
MIPSRENIIKNLIKSRDKLPRGTECRQTETREGGCGVTGFISSIQLSGRHIIKPSIQMHNRGNGKGGGIAAVGLSADDLGVDQNILDTHYLLQIAVLDKKSLHEMEKKFIKPVFEVHNTAPVTTLDNYRDVTGLEVKPPDVFRYFVRVKSKVLEKFINENNLHQIEAGKAEDEFIYQNSWHLNQKYYASMGEKKAFVLSHGRNMMIFKIVGYAEDAARYYMLDIFKAHGWIAHQRYPTKGRVWHPGGAHPFCGLDEALVHNGDFANYHGVSEYLKQNNIFPQFLTDTEVAVLLFDLLNRTFNYPLEYIFEAIAPTTEHDFDRLPPLKQKIYRRIQSSHIHGSPDGPWFFIIARNDVRKKHLQLMGITDTAMLRPQVFAIHDGEVQIGLICSEKQAIDATLQSLAEEDTRICSVADKYWNARGGSAADGGAFVFTVKDSSKNNNLKELTCTNKFGEIVAAIPNTKSITAEIQSAKSKPAVSGMQDSKSLEKISEKISKLLSPEERKPLPNQINECINYCINNVKEWDYSSFREFCQIIVRITGRGDIEKNAGIKILTFVNDHFYGVGGKRRSVILEILRSALKQIFLSFPEISENSSSEYCLINYDTREKIRQSQKNEKILVINAENFPPEGRDCDARLIGAAYELGWRRFICFGYRGQRFCGCGLGIGTSDVKIDVYDSAGDYLASGIDGAEIYVHGNAQDQLGQIMKSGKLVIYGDVGQTFMYGAKGGNVYVMGNAAGRPLINAVGCPRVVINGTCLDYLAESFMAGNPLNGGGFVILNGIEFSSDGKIIAQDIPYPGSNLFSLASGGAIYLRDPNKLIVNEQLNGGEFSELSSNDWKLILPYLEENERLFGISIDRDLLSVDGKKMTYNRIYRKVQAVKLDILLSGTETLNLY